MIKNARSLSTIWSGSEDSLVFKCRYRCVIGIDVIIVTRLPSESAGTIKAVLDGQGRNVDPIHSPMPGIVNAEIMAVSRRNSGIQMQYRIRAKVKEPSAVRSWSISTRRNKMSSENLHVASTVFVFPGVVKYVTLFPKKSPKIRIQTRNQDCRRSPLKKSSRNCKPVSRGSILENHCNFPSAVSSRFSRRLRIISQIRVRLELSCCLQIRKLFQEMSLRYC
jgi:hypothetical protein